MRETFFKSLEKLSQHHENIFLLTGDLGYKLFDPFRINNSERFYNVGLAEANMISLAAGLSLCDKNVYCYSLIPFLVLRAFEQIRVDIAYHNLNIKLVGAGVGVTYGLEGFTHFALEDLALMRSLPNMTIVVPADPVEAQCVADISSEYNGPMYIRLGRTGEPAIHEKVPDFKIGKAMVLKEGKDAAIFAIGNMVYQGKQVVDLLATHSIEAALVNMHTLKPLDLEAIGQIASTHKAIFSLEEHYIDGGLGSALAEVLAETGYHGLFKRIGIDKLNSAYIGKADYLREKYGLSVETTFAKILKELI